MGFTAKLIIGLVIIFLVWTVAYDRGMVEKAPLDYLKSSNINIENPLAKTANEPVDLVIVNDAINGSAIIVVPIEEALLNLGLNDVEIKLLTDNYSEAKLREYVEAEDVKGLRNLI